MRDNSLVRVGGTAAILLGLINAVGSALYLLLPADQRAAVPAAVILPSMVRDGATVLYLIFWTQAIVGVLGMLVVPALSRTVERVPEAWVRWTTNLATFGFGISAVGYLLDIERLLNIANAYVAGSDETKNLLKAIWKSSLDEQGFWGYGAVGAWVLVAALSQLRDARHPRLLGYLGLALALLYLLTPPAVMLKNQPTLLLIVGIGTLVTPVWYIWSGLLARRRAGTETA